ncbi:MAG: ribosomal protein S18-alanine N-acetyltransferase [Chloroflexota bacterium]
MSYYVRLMCQEDIAQVTEINREAFPTEWPPANYRHELQNQLAHYIVVCDGEKTTDKIEVKAHSGLTQRLRQLFGLRPLPTNEPPPSDRHYVVGFVGFWVLADEAHITAIAVREAYRRHGVGELLLIASIDLATELKAHIVTLEVRVSNIVAQSLYSKYGFIRAGIRRGYYTDNREDGIIMSTPEIGLTPFREHFQQLKQIYSGKWGKPAINLFGKHPVPPGKR